MSKLVSIITPTYNHEKYIGECIESVLNQTYKNWEMIIVDDCSSDKTVEIIKKYAAQDSRIKLIQHNENYGPFRLKDTCNEGLNISKGEYIAVLEGDDYWTSDKLEEQVKFLENNPDMILNWGNCIVVNNQGKTISYLKVDPQNQEILNNPVGSILHRFIELEGPIYAQSLIIRREALERIGGFQGGKNIPSWDGPTTTALALEGKFSCIDKNFGYWRRHNDSVAYNYSKDMKSMRSYSEFYIEFLEKNKDKLEILGFHYSTNEIIKKQNEKIKMLEKRSNCYNGYFLLSINDFENAKKCFCRVLKQKDISIKYKGISVLGLLSSYLKIDLISLIRLKIPKMGKIK